MTASAQHQSSPAMRHGVGKVTFSSPCHARHPLAVTGKQSNTVLIHSCFLNISISFKKEEY